MRKLLYALLVGVMATCFVSCADVALVGSTDYLYTDYYVYAYPHTYYHRPVPPPRPGLAPRPHKPRPQIAPNRGHQPNQPQSQPRHGRGNFGGRR